MSISVAMIVLNEEDLLNYCFKAIHSLSSELKEVVVIDGFSTDSTMGIIKKWSDSLPIIVQQNEMLDFATQRNLALDKCTGDWILHMDADETFTTNLLAEFQAGAFNKADLWDFPKYSTNGDVYHYEICGGVGPTTRLFKNIGFRYEREVHEYLVYPGQTGWDSTHRGGVNQYCNHVWFFDHTGLKSDKGLLEKGQRYMRFNEGSTKAGIPLGEDPTLFLRNFRHPLNETTISLFPFSRDLIFEKDD